MDGVGINDTGYIPLERLFFFFLQSGLRNQPVISFPKAALPMGNEISQVLWVCKIQIQPVFKISLDYMKNFCTAVVVIFGRFLISEVAEELAGFYPLLKQIHLFKKIRAEKPGACWKLRQRR